MRQLFKSKRHLFWVVIALLFLLSAGRALWLETRSSLVSNKTVIRIGFGDSRPMGETALRAVAEDYMRLHPDITIEVNRVPHTIYLQYLRTQFTGQTAPDILQISSWFRGVTEMRDRYMLPLTRWLDEPNPYNAGTDIGATPWRKTFLGGLNNQASYSSDLRDYFGVSMMIATVRIFYNQDLLKEITGRTGPPSSFRDLLAMSREIQTYAQAHDHRIVPFAGCQLSAIFVMSPSFCAVNQELYQQLDRRRTLSLDQWDYAKTYLQNDWDFSTPSIRAGYELVRELGTYQKPGFMQLDGGDANFEFTQGRAVMFAAMAGDAVALESQASFGIGAFPIPAPTADDPAYGSSILGPVSELAHLTGFVLGVNKLTAHRKEAIDFLQYLSSHRGNEKFAELSGWLPAVEGAKIPAIAESHRPVLLGYPGRFWGEMNGGGDAKTMFKRNMHLLVSHEGSTEIFCNEMQRSYGPTMSRDLARHARETMRNVSRQESAILGSWQVSRRSADTLPSMAQNRSWTDDHDQLLGAQNRSEAEALQTRYLLWKHPAKSTD